MTPPRASIGWPSLAADDRAAWDAGGQAEAGRSVVRAESLATQASHRSQAVDAAIATLVEVPVTAMSNDEVRRELRSVEAARRMLEARSCRLTSALTSRAAADARAASPDNAPRAGERAARQVRAELVDDLRLTPSAVLGAQRIGDRVDGSPLVAAALDAGTITPDHVRAIDRTLQHLDGPERQQAEEQLVEVATTSTARDVHDAGVRLLCALDHDAAVDAEERKHARRDVHVVRGRDGTVRINGGVAGLQGELLLTTWHAYRRPDRPGERRTPGQRGADALFDLCRSALGEEEVARIASRHASDTSATLGTTVDTSATADATAADRGTGAPPRRARRDRVGPSTQHGIQPHISVTIDLDTLLTGEGVAETDWSGPIPWGAIRDKLIGADLTFIAVRDEVPVAVTTKTRYIPVGVWKAVKLRDNGCIRVHCDAPASWCQVAHLAQWFTDGGKLSLDTAGLLCTGDHREFDAGRLAVTWIDGRPIVHPPGEAPPGADPPGDPPGDPP